MRQISAGDDERRVKRAQTWELGPPSAPAEIYKLFDLPFIFLISTCIYFSFFGMGGPIPKTSLIQCLKREPL